MQYYVNVPACSAAEREIRYIALDELMISLASGPDQRSDRIQIALVPGREVIHADDLLI